MFVSARNAAITSSVGRSLEGYSSKAQVRTTAFLDHHDSSVAAWLSLTGALHGCVYDRTAAYYPGEGYSKVKTARKAMGNRLGYFP